MFFEEFLERPVIGVRNLGEELGVVDGQSNGLNGDFAIQTLVVVPTFGGCASPNAGLKQALGVICEEFVAKHTVERIHGDIETAQNRLDFCAVQFAFDYLLEEGLDCLVGNKQAQVFGVAGQ